MVTLDDSRAVLLERVLPWHTRFGTLAFAYLDSSLVSGYTDDSPLYPVPVWDVEAGAAAAR